MISNIGYLKLYFFTVFVRTFLHGFHLSMNHGKIFVSTVHFVFMGFKTVSEANVTSQMYSMKYGGYTVV